MATKITRLPSNQFRSRGYKTISTPFFLLKLKKNPVDKARLGVVAGVSVHKSAVKRNFFKRQVSAGLASRIASGNDILIIVLPAASRATKKKFKEELARTITRAQS